MQLHNIRHFLAVCETGSINKAAQHCRVSQPSITRSIKNLEFEFGGVLFKRNSNGCSLTALGQEVKPQFEQLATTLDTVKTVAQRNIDRSTSALKFGITCTLNAASVQSYLEGLSSLSSSSPPQIVEAPSESIVEQILAGDLDAGLVAEPSYPNNLVSYELFQERFVISFGKGHRFEEKATVSYSELKRECYVMRLNCELRGRAIEYAPNSEEFELDVVFQSSQEQWVQNMVAAGYGVSVHPEYMPVVEGVLQRPLRDPDMSRTISLAMLESKCDLPAMRRLAKMTSHHFGSIEL